MVGRGSKSKKNFLGGGGGRIDEFGRGGCWFEKKKKKPPDLRSLEVGISVSQTNKSVDHEQNTPATTTVTR